MIFSIDWIGWSWLWLPWNFMWYSIIGIIAFLSATASLAALIPIFIVLIIIILILVIFFILLDGPVLLSIFIAIVVSLTVAILLVVTAPIWLLVLGLIIPFDEVFYVWIALMMFVLLWEVILPWVGGGLQQTEI